MRLRSTANRNPAAPNARDLLFDGATPFGDGDEAAGNSSFAVLATGDERIDPLVSAAFSTTDPEVAKVRAVRTRILASFKHDADEDRPTLLAIVGIGSGDETSVLSANLATVFAQLGSNTLLVDGGLDRPTIHALFRLPNETGLTDHLETPQTSLAAQQTAIPKLWVMPAGQENARAGAYLHRRALAEVIDQWALPATQIVVCLPNIDTDATPLGSVLEGFDSVVLVARRGETKVAELRRAIDDLDAKAVPVAGSVIG